MFVPTSVGTRTEYSWPQLSSDLIARLVVGVVVLPLEMAFAIAACMRRSAGCLRWTRSRSAAQFRRQAQGLFSPRAACPGHISVSSRAAALSAKIVRWFSRKHTLNRAWHSRTAGGNAGRASTGGSPRFGAYWSKSAGDGGCCEQSRL